MEIITRTTSSKPNNKIFQCVLILLNNENIRIPPEIKENKNHVPFDHLRTANHSKLGLSYLYNLCSSHWRLGGYKSNQSGFQIWGCCHHTPVWVQFRFWRQNWIPTIGRLLLSIKISPLSITINQFQLIGRNLLKNVIIYLIIVKISSFNRETVIFHENSPFWPFLTNFNI